MATNLWPNADLESGTTGWAGKDGASVSHSSTQAWEQTYSCKGTLGTGGWEGVKSPWVAIDSDTQYTASAYFYPTETVECLFEIRVNSTDSGDGDLKTSGYSTETADEWTRRTATFTSAVSGENFVQIVYFKSNDATAEDVYVDAVMLETGGSASAWVNYSSGTDIAVGNVGTMEIAGLNPTILAATSFTVGNVGAIEIAGLNPLVSVGAGLWEIGAYIYNALGGTQINVGNVGVIEIAGLDPTVLANTTLTVGNVGAIEIAGLNPTVDFTQAISVGNVGGIEIAGLNPTVGYTLSSNDSGIDGPRIMTVLLLRG